MRCAVDLRQDGLGGLDVFWGEEEKAFVGHSDKLHTLFVSSQMHMIKKKKICWN